MKYFILKTAAMLLIASPAYAQFGYSATTDLVFTPVTPCRVLDTRPSQGGTGPIAATGTKNFQIWGASSYADQGGSPTNCGLTAGSDIAAVAMNFTVVTPAAGGFITAYPFGVALPTAATVNFQAGDIARGDFTIAKVTQSGTSHLSVYSSSNADVVGDVVGFYAKPLAAALDCYTTPEVTVSVAAGAFGTGVAQACGSTYYSFPTSCYSDGTDFVAIPNSFACTLKNTSASTQTMKYQRRCCRIPGR